MKILFMALMLLNSLPAFANQYCIYNAYYQFQNSLTNAALNYQNDIKLAKLEHTAEMKWVTLAMKNGVDWEVVGARKEACDQAYFKKISAADVKRDQTIVAANNTYESQWKQCQSEK